MGKNRKVAKPEPKRKVDICRHVHSLAFPPFDFLDFCWMLLSWMMCLKTAQAPSTNEKITKKLTSQLWCLNSKPKRKSQKVEKGLAFHFCFFFVQMSFQMFPAWGVWWRAGGNAVHPRCHPHIFLLVLPRSWTDSTKVLSHSFRPILKKMRAS